MKPRLLLDVFASARFGAQRLCILGTLILFSSCSAVSREQPRGVPITPSEITAAEAMMAIYGNYDAGHQSAIWTGTPPADCITDLYAGNTLLVRARLFQQVQEAGRPKAYLVTDTRPDDPNWGMHTDAPLFGIAAFSWDGRRWRVEAQDINTRCLGSLGELPAFSLVQWAENHHGLLVSAGFTSAGETTVNTLLFAAIGSNVTEIANIPETDFNNCISQDIECRKKESTVKFILIPNSPYYELRVETRETQGRSQPENTQQRFRFDGTAYTLIRTPATGNEAALVCHDVLALIRQPGSNWLYYRFPNLQPHDFT
jgi:hypothetical protein